MDPPLPPPPSSLPRTNAPLWIGLKVLTPFKEEAQRDATASLAGTCLVSAAVLSVIVPILVVSEPGNDEKKEKRGKKEKAKKHKKAGSDTEDKETLRSLSASPPLSDDSPAASSPVPSSALSIRSQPATPISSPVQLRATHSTPSLELTVNPPLLMFVNPKSGAQQGTQLLSMMTKVPREKLDRVW